jgi:hypothetical protein
MIKPIRSTHLPGWLRRQWPAVLCVGIFCLLAAALYGWGSPVSTSYVPAKAFGDALQEVWFLAWPAYAISHGLNPLYSNFVAYPRGIDLMSSTSMPLLGVLSAPVSLTLGPVASYNLLLRLAPILSASSLMFVLRRWVRWWPAAFVGGLLFGFSPFVFAEGRSHLFLTFLPLPPLMLLLLDDLLVRRRRSPRVAGALLGLVAAAQLLISAEVLAITALMAVAGMAVVALRRPSAARERFRAVVAGLAVALGLFGLLAGYPVFMYLAGARHLSVPQHPRGVYYGFHDDLLSTIIPTSYQSLGAAAWKRTGDALAQGDPVDHASYLGVTLLAALAYFGLRYRRQGIVAVSTLLGAAALVLTLGPTLYLNGSVHYSAVGLPYDWLLGLPFLDSVLAPRFVFVAYLGAAIVLAVGLDRLRLDLGRRAPTFLRPGRLASAVCCAIAIVALTPLLPSGAYAQARLPLPRFFSTQGLLDRHVPAGSVLLAYPNVQKPTLHFLLPSDTRSMLWQAVSGMRFRIIGAYAAQPSGSGLGVGNELLLAPKAVQRFFGWALYGPRSIPHGRPSPQLPQLLARFCLRYDVATIVVDPTVGVDPAAVVHYVSRALGSPPQRLGGIDAWFGVDGTLRRADGRHPEETVSQ